MPKISSKIHEQFIYIFIDSNDSIHAIQVQNSNNIYSSILKLISVLEIHWYVYFRCHLLKCDSNFSREYCWLFVCLILLSVYDSIWIAKATKKELLTMKRRKSTKEKGN